MSVMALRDGLSWYERRQRSMFIDFPDRRSGCDRRSGRDRRSPYGFRTVAGMDRRRRVPIFSTAAPVFF